MAKTKLNDCDITMVIGLYKASELVCKKYENGIKQYDGSINTNTKEYETFKNFNNKRLRLLEELEKRVNNIE